MRVGCEGVKWGTVYRKRNWDLKKLKFSKILKTGENRPQRISNYFIRHIEAIRM